MALIRCRACGRAISDRAWACVHCGCPAEREYDRREPITFQKTRGRCPDCGREISVHTKVCVDCGFPVEAPGSIL